jgi:hypothetical protein
MRGQVRGQVGSGNVLRGVDNNAVSKEVASFLGRLLGAAESAHQGELGGEAGHAVAEI